MLLLGLCVAMHVWDNMLGVANDKFLLLFMKLSMIIFIALDDAFHFFSSCCVSLLSIFKLATYGHWFVFVANQTWGVLVLQNKLIKEFNCWCHFVLSQTCILMSLLVFFCYIWTHSGPSSFFVGGFLLQIEPT